MAKVTIGGLRRIIREELEKVIRENEDEDDFGSDEETDALIGTRVEIDEDGYISPYGADFGPTKFGPSMMFEPGDEVELVSFDESGSGAWVVRGPDGEEETLKATMGGGSNDLDDENASFEIPDVSVHAEGAGMTTEEFCDVVKQMASKYSSIEFGPPNALDSGDGYSDEYDSLYSLGNRSELESLARELDEELMGGAQSIGEEDSFVNFVQDI